MENLDLKRARFAAEKIAKIKEMPPKKQTEYKSLVKSVPSMIINNGLGQTMGFLKAKDKDHHRALHGHVLDWFRQSGLIPAPGTLDDILKAPDDTYRLMAQETLTLMNWFKKIADAELA